MYNYKLSSDWENLKKIVIFGYGRQAKKIINKFAEDFEIVAIVDNDQNKWNTMSELGVKIDSFEEAIPMLKKYKVIVTAMASNYNTIKKQLSDIGLKEYLDFVQHEFFITEWYYRFKKQVCLLKTDVFVTSLCTLKCEKCASFIPYWKEKVNIEVEDIKDTVDLFFSKVDFLFSMDFYGGEPFLYKNLTELIIYIKEKYGTKIGYLGIITNGTIVPNEATINVLSKYNVGVSISDYSNAINYKESVDNLCRVLSENNISFTRNKNLIWKDVDFPNGTCHYEGKAAEIHRLCCNTTCHGICDDKKIYFCAIALTAKKGRLFNVSENDYLDLNENFEDREEEKQRLLDFTVGICKDDLYTGICNVCRGFGLDNQNIISAGEQIV